MIADTLQTSFGFESFRPHQEEIVESILGGRDVFAALPTGGGKSLCYQLPSILLPGLTVVVSPLIALMRDQVYGAQQNGLEAAALNSSLSPAESHSVWSGLASGSVRLLYVSPERLALSEFRSRLGEMSVSLFAIDEAHCISEWGHEFRPDYRSLSVLKEEFPTSTVAAFTATATARVQKDVVAQLELDDPLLVRGDFDRPEIYYRVERKTGGNGQIIDFVAEHPGEPGIIYRTTRKSVESTTSQLRKRGIRALPYHAGLSDSERSRNQDIFVRDESEVIVATIAFGMGIDKSNVRWILHGDLPRSLEAYYQETGRAGRDGAPAEACLLYGPQDVASIRYHIDQMENSVERERSESSLREMLRFAGSGVCRRTQLLAHFDQHHAGNCGGCDTCRGGKIAVDRSVEAQKAMSAIKRTGERFGAHHIADVVSGTDTERTEQFGHDRLPTFGAGDDKPREWWLGLIQDLEAAGLVGRSDGPRSGLAITPTGREVLFGRDQFQVTDREIQPRRRKTASQGTGLSRQPETSRVSADDEALFADLRKLRLGLAREQGVPPYVIFSDRSLREMAAERPTDRMSFLAVHGVGERKLSRYGDVFLKAIEAFDDN